MSLTILPYSTNSSNICCRCSAHAVGKVHILKGQKQSQLTTAPPSPFISWHHPSMAPISSCSSYVETLITIKSSSVNSSGAVPTRSWLSLRSTPWDPSPSTLLLPSLQSLSLLSACNGPLRFLWSLAHHLDPIYSAGTDHFRHHGCLEQWWHLPWWLSSFQTCGAYSLPGLPIMVSPVSPHSAVRDEPHVSSGPPIQRLTGLIMSEGEKTTFVLSASNSGSSGWPGALSNIQRTSKGSPSQATYFRTLGTKHWWNQSKTRELTVQVLLLAQPHDRQLVVTALPRFGG